MHKLIIAVAVSCTAASAQVPMTQSIDQQMQALPALRVSVGTTALSCERELDAAMIGKTDAQAEALFNNAARPIRLQEPVQLTVRLGTANVTSDPRIGYLPNACLIVTKFGLVTAAQTDDRCTPGTPTTLMIVLDDATKTKAWNTCFFKIIQ
jgi:hypothetical protein